MSVIQLYSVETKFNEKKKEYLSLMDSINYSCLGKDKTSVECVKAARLNAEMQSYLIEMSNLLNKNNFQDQSSDKIKKHQFDLLKLSDKLEEDLDMLKTNAALQQDISVLEEQNRLHALSWGFMAVLFTGLVIYQYKKI